MTQIGSKPLRVLLGVYFVGLMGHFVFVSVLWGFMPGLSCCFLLYKDMGTISMSSKVRIFHRCAGIRKELHLLMSEWMQYNNTALKCEPEFEQVALPPKSSIVRIQKIWLMSRYSGRVCSNVAFVVVVQC